MLRVEKFHLFNFYDSALTTHSKRPTFFSLVSFLNESFINKQLHSPLSCKTKLSLSFSFIICCLLFSCWKFWFIKIRLNCRKFNSQKVDKTDDKSFECYLRLFTSFLFHVKPHFCMKKVDSNFIKFKRQKSDQSWFPGSWQAHLYNFLNLSTLIALFAVKCILHLFSWMNTRMSCNDVDENPLPWTYQRYPLMSCLFGVCTPKGILFMTTILDWNVSPYRNALIAKNIFFFH